MKAKRAAVYLRCSTKSQETEMQEAEITDYLLTSRVGIQNLPGRGAKWR